MEKGCKEKKLRSVVFEMIKRTIAYISSYSFLFFPISFSLKFSTGNGRLQVTWHTESHKTGQKKSIGKKSLYQINLWICSQYVLELCKLIYVQLNEIFLINIKREGIIINKANFYEILVLARRYWLIKLLFF